MLSFICLCCHRVVVIDSLSEMHFNQHLCSACAELSDEDYVSKLTGRVYKARKKEKKG